jgi:site-specific recombinase XerD
VSGPTWPELQNGYLDHIARLGFSQFTLEKHRGLLTELVAWSLENGRRDPRAMTRVDVLAFLASIIRPGWKPQTRNERLGVLKRFFLWATLEEKLFASPAREIEYAQVPESLVDYLRQDELVRLLDSCNTAQATGVRDRAILELLYSTGIRLGELCALNLDDVDRDAGIVSIWQGKGGKDRKVPIGRIALAVLDRYVNSVRRPAVLGDNALFLGEKGHRLARPVVEQMIQRRAETVGLKKRVYPHLLRHTCAVHLLEGGADIRYIQALLGHASLRTTQRYTRVLPLAVKRAHARSHPAERRRSPRRPADPLQYYRSRPIPARDRDDDEDDGNL